MSRFDIYYAYQKLYQISHLISQEEYLRIDAELYAALEATR
jgi:hypothetical protein